MLRDPKGKGTSFSSNTLLQRYGGKNAFYGCRPFGVLYWFSDYWQETGVFNVNNTFVIPLDVHYQIRNDVQISPCRR